MAVDCGDKNLVRKALFEDIRVENIQEGRLFHINVRFNSKYDKQPGRGIEDIIFRNIIYNGVGENPSLLKGFDKERSVKNIIFDNVIINGMKMKNIDDFITNEYIKNITNSIIWYMKYEWKNLFVLGANFFSSNIKLSLG